MKPDYPMSIASRYGWSLCVVVAMALVLAGTAQSQPTTGPKTGRLVIIYTNNNNGYLSDCGCGTDPLGGLAKRKTLFDQIKTRFERPLFLDAGDLLGPFAYEPDRDTMVAQVYGLLGYDAINVGDQELINGTDFFMRQLVNRGLPLISTDLPLKNGLDPPIKKNLVLSVNGISVGLLGLLNQDAFAYYPENIPVPAEINYSHERLQQFVEEIRPDVDFLILLSHLGYDADVVVAENVTGIDLIVGGHSQAELNEAELVNRTLIVQAGGDGQYVGELILDLNSNDKIAGFKNRLIPLNSDVPKDPDILELVGPFDNQ